MIGPDNPLHGFIPLTLSEGVQIATALGAITLPTWYEPLKEISAVAALFAPIFGVILSAFFIYEKAVSILNKSKDPPSDDLPPS